MTRMEREITIDETLARRVLELVDCGLSRGLGVAKPGKMCIEAVVRYAMGLGRGDDPPCVSRALRSFKIKMNDVEWSSNEARAKGLRRLALIQLGSAEHLNDEELVRRLAELAIRKAIPAALRSAASIRKNTSQKALLLEHAAICEHDGTHNAALDARKAAASVAFAAEADADASAAAAYAAAAAAAAADAYAAASAAAAAFAAGFAADGFAADADGFAADADGFAADADAAAAAFAAYAAASAADAYAAEADAAAADAYAAEADAAAADAYAAAARDKSLAGFAEAVVQLLIDMEVPGTRWLELAPLAKATS